MHRRFASLLLMALAATGLLQAQQGAQLNDGDAHGDAPYLLEDGWTPLLDGKDLSGWHAQDGQPLQWFTTRAIRWERLLGPTRLMATPGPGGKILNSAQGRTSNLVTDEKFGDVELYL